MKKCLLAGAALVTLTGTAHAQSSVTLYGIVDNGISYNSNAGGHTLYKLSSGVMQGSRWGVRGIEDLGGGLKTIFALESGFDLAFDLETVEQRNAVFVELDLAGVLRHHLADEGQGFVLGFNAVDQHFADVLAQVIADLRKK